MRSLIVFAAAMGILASVLPMSVEAKQTPTNPAVLASNDFAVDLYQRLAGENAGKNLFFSPYSMSVALAMTAEGARKETAEEMGRVLRFPQVLRQNDPQLPWKMQDIHAGMQQLHQRFTPKPVSAEVQAKIADLRQQLAESNSAAKQFQKNNDFEKLVAQQNNTQKLANELNRLLSQVDQYELRSANALWGEKTYPFQQSYLDTINRFYGTGAAVPVDFVHDAEAVRQRINGWVEEQTNQRIKDLLPQGVVCSDTRLILTNAVYFKGEWSAPFDVRNTTEADFLSPAGKVRATMMRHDGMEGIRYGAFKADGGFFATPRMMEGELPEASLYPGKGGFLMAELPYKGKQLTMVLLVPRDADGLGGLEKKLTGANLQTWISRLETRKVNVHMPRFKMETAYENMKDTLQAMGMVRAFTGAAQFEGICSSDRLAISQVVHKAFVDVNEKGTEAAAATAVMISRMCAMIDFVPTFRADRPFIFAIRDVKSDTILFMGRVVLPGK